MYDGNGSTGNAGVRSTDWPTAKQRTAVRHAVDRLLDDLAPSPRVGRVVDRQPTAVQRYRSPNGCILQAAAGAVSVSWFPALGTEAAFGELQVIAWRGVVSRPGSARREVGGAVTVRQEVLRPVEVAPDAWAWRAADNAVYDAVTLAARCHALLEAQMTSDGPVRLAG
jgi:hypothetical protein